MSSKAIRRDAGFQPEFREDLRYWMETDRRVALRVLDLIEAVMRDPFSGIGKPEPLKYLAAGTRSRRITQEHWNHLIHNVRRHEQPLAIKAQLLDRIADVLQRQMGRGLAEALAPFRIPAPGQFLERAHVQVAIMEIRLQFRHTARQKPPVLTDAVAAHRRFAPGHVEIQEFQGLQFGLALIRRAGADPRDQTGFAVLFLVPVVHRCQHCVILVDGQHRPFSQDVELAVGHDGRDFNDAVGLRVQTGHLQINPDQVVGGHGFFVG